MATKSDSKKSRSGQDVVVGGAVSSSVIVVGNNNIAVDRSGDVVGRDVVITHEQDKRILSQDQAFERIGAAIRSNLIQLDQNLAQSREESGQFFRLTLIFAALGFLVVIAGVALLLAGQVTAGIVSTIASLIPEVTATLFFQKDKELRNTIERYHQQVLDSQRILTMVDVAETVNDKEEQDALKKEIIYKALDIESTQRN
jgi:hypothetical protein